MRILVVDDDTRVLAAFRRLLELRGHRVEAFDRAREALEAFAARPHGFDAALLDVDIARDDGVALAEQLRALHPTLRLGFATGSDISARRARAHGPVLTKPCTAEAIFALVDGWK